MIIKFDHFTYVFQRNTYVDYDDSKILFKENSLINPPGKKAFMHVDQHDSDVIFIDDDIPVEYVGYNELSDESDMYIKDGRLFAKYDPDYSGIIEEVLSERMGFGITKNKKNYEVNLKGVFDKADRYLVLESSPYDEKTYLDSGGWQCPCVLVDSVRKLFSNITDLSGCTTTLDTLKVNNRDLEIGFFRMNGLQPIIEFISPMGRCRNQ